MTPARSRAHAPKRAARERPGEPGGRRDTNRREKIAALQDAALALFLRRSIDGVTIDDITSRAGVAKGSFYRYFADKTALVGALVAPLDEAVAEMFEASLARLGASRDPDDVFACYEVIAARLLLLLRDHPRVLRLYLQEARIPAPGARGPVARVSDRLATTAIAHATAVRARGFGEAYPPAVSALAVIGAGERLIHALLTGEHIEEIGDPLRAAHDVISLALRGIRAGPENQG